MLFRNFLRAPSGAQSFGSNFGGVESDRLAYMRRLMGGLARQLSVPYRWPVAVQLGREAWENPEIPSGYAYFAQLVAHDCVFTSIPTGVLSTGSGSTISQRSSLLRLETIYGLGPDSSPHAYVPFGASYLARNRLALSGVSLRSTKKGDYFFRDIARIGMSNSDSGAAVSLTSAQVSDARNDIHAAISQITTLFLLLHNKIVSIIENILEGEVFASEEVKNYRIYFVSRAVCENIYRAIVRNDLLPRILHPAIIDEYSAPHVQFLDLQALDTLPVEFAIVFRFGHAMVRPFYVFNDFNNYGEDLVDMMLSTSAARPWRMPLDDTWMAQWSHFFEIGGSKPNLSRRIGPEFSGGLFSGEVFGATDETGNVGLGYRDLLSGASVATWSVAALADELRRCKPQTAGLSALLIDDEQRAIRIRTWLSQHRIANGLNEQEIDNLAADPPLFLYVLFEAAHDMHGERLGVLGSVILAEILYKALLDASPPSRGAIDEFGRAFEHACEIAFGRTGAAASIEQHMPRINTMANLITFVADEFDSNRAVMPFV